MKNLPSDNKGQLDLPKQLLHWGVLGQRTSVEFQLLVHTEEQPCQVFPRQGENDSVVLRQNGNCNIYFKQKALEKM